MIFKEMDYNGKGKSEIICFKEFDDGTALAVINVRGSHPCCYIQFPEINKVQNYEDLVFYDKETDDYWDVHYGFTFLGELKHYGLEGEWIGWDYAHLGDWTQTMSVEDDVFDHNEEKKWTTKELLDECLEALQFIRKGKYEIDNYEEKLLEFERDMGEEP